MLNPNQPIKLMGICEVCESETTVSFHYGNMKFCDDCWEKEERASIEHQSLANQQKRIDENNAKITENKVIQQSIETDNRIQIRTDLFNAATKSIIDIKQAIDSDETITNKPYRLAEVLTNRFNHYKTVVFELNSKLMEAGNEQRAIQTYLNQLANQLRAEEREKLKIADINYKPNPVKSISPKTISTRTTSVKRKIDKKELRAVAAQLGVSEFTLQMVVVSKNISVAEAAELLKKSIDASKG